MTDGRNRHGTDLDNAPASLDEIIHLTDQELKAQSGRRTSHQYTLNEMHSNQPNPSPPTHLPAASVDSRFPAPSVPPPLEMPPPPPLARPSLVARQHELTQILQANDIEEYQQLLQIANNNLRIKSQQHEDTIKDLNEAKKKLAAVETDNTQLKSKVDELEWQSKVSESKIKALEEQLSKVRTASAAAVQTTPAVSHSQSFASPSSSTSSSTASASTSSSREELQQPLLMQVPQNDPPQTSTSRKPHPLDKYFSCCRTM